MNPQPEVDPEGNETGEFADVDQNKPLELLLLKSWTTNMAP